MNKDNGGSRKSMINSPGNVKDGFLKMSFRG